MVGENGRFRKNSQRCSVLTTAVRTSFSVVSGNTGPPRAPSSSPLPVSPFRVCRAVAIVVRSSCDSAFGTSVFATKITNRTVEKNKNKNKTKSETGRKRPRRLPRVPASDEWNAVFILHNKFTNGVDEDGATTLCRWLWRWWWRYSIAFAVRLTGGSGGDDDDDDDNNVGVMSTRLRGQMPITTTTVRTGFSHTVFRERTRQQQQLL